MEMVKTDSAAVAVALEAPLLDWEAQVLAGVDTALAAATLPEPLQMLVPVEEVEAHISMWEVAMEVLVLYGSGGLNDVINGKPSGKCLVGHSA